MLLENTNLALASLQSNMDLFHELNEKEHRTIVLITHSLPLSEETQRILTLMDGRIIGDRKGKYASGKH